MKEFLNKELRLGCIASPIAVPIGIVLVYLILAAIMLDFGGALAVYAVSIICTVGISLILWVPIWYIVGYGVLTVLRFTFGLNVASMFKSKSKPKPSQATPQPTQPALTRDQQALLNYIKKAQAKGLSKTQISSNLQNNGWNSDSIIWAFNFANGQGTV